MKAPLHRRLDGVRALRGHPDRRMRPLQAAREHGGLRDLEVLAVVAERLAREAEQDHVDRFFPARPALAQILTEALELVALIAAAEADVETTAGEQVDGRDLLG